MARSGLVCFRLKPVEYSARNGQDDHVIKAGLNYPIQIVVTSI